FPALIRGLLHVRGMQGERFGRKGQRLSPGGSRNEDHGDRIRHCHSRSISHVAAGACYNGPMRLLDYAPRPAHLRWLLDSDPAIRWQGMRDLTGAAPAAIE